MKPRGAQGTKPGWLLGMATQKSDGDCSAKDFSAILITCYGIEECFKDEGMVFAMIDSLQAGDEGEAQGVGYEVGIELRLSVVI